MNADCRHPVDSSSLLPRPVLRERAGVRVRAVDAPHQSNINRSEPSPNLSRRTGRGASAGFAAIFAITLLLLVAVTLAVMGRYFANEATRTRAAKSDAQLRQLITAGIAVAIQRADHPAASDAVALPPALQADGATLNIKLTGEADQRTAILRATLGPRTIEQTLQLSRADNRWHVR